MTLQRQATFWFMALAALILFLYVLSDILLPFVAGLALAYFLDPLADRIERTGAGRLAATSIILAIFALIFVLALLIVVPILVDQFSGFADRFPTYIQTLSRFLNESGPDWLKKVFAEGSSSVEESMSIYAAKGAAWIATLLRSLWSGGMALVSVLSLVVITPIVAFYMLYDWDRMIALVDSWLPRDHAAQIREIVGEIDTIMAGFVRGQGTVCLLLGVFYGIALTLAGLNFGLLIGLVSGLVSFVPFFGAILGLAVSAGVAMVQFWPDWVQILIIVAVFSAGQFLEGNILSPKLVGGSIGLHPVWLIFALFAFGFLFGFVGMLVAVPLAAAVGVLVRFALKRYLASPLYLGTGNPPGMEDD